VVGEGGRVSVYESLIDAFGKEKPDVTHRGDAVRYFPDPPDHYTCPWCGSLLACGSPKCTQCGGPQG